MGRPINKNRQPRMRFATILPVGHLSDYPNYVEVARRASNETPPYNNDDPLVYYSRPSGKGPQPPADLFYLQMCPGWRVVRVYIKEVVDDA